MKKFNIKGKRVLYPLLFIILSAVIIINVIRITSHRGPEKVIPYRVENGWGYKIEVRGQVVVNQPFIPLLPGMYPFPDKRVALKTGKLVLSRLKKDQIPVLTIDDLKDLGLFPEIPENR